MKSLSLLAALMLAAAFADAPLGGMPGAARAARLDAVVAAAVGKAVAATWKTPLTNDQVAVTVVDLARPDAPAFGAFRGDVPIYPASVVKMFYLAAAHRWMEDGRIADTTELRRALRDMIVESYNEPTHYVVDLLTGTTSGPELPAAELRSWWEKRNAVNRWFASLGYPASINASKKPWCEGPYGRETQAIEAHEPKRNLLTTDATARLLAEIALGRCVTAERSRQMLGLMRRDFAGPTDDPEDQAHGYTGIALGAGTNLWSKCGLTSQVRHDAALVERPDGARLVIVTFTTGHSGERGIIPAVAAEILAAPR
jgi:beta-lactamase class A